MFERVSVVPRPASPPLLGGAGRRGSHSERTAITVAALAIVAGVTMLVLAIGVQFAP